MNETSLPPRLELFSDAVFAIIITIMVLEIHPPESAEIHDLIPLIPIFLSYLLSFINLIIYWNNHHHLLTTMGNPSGKIMWANALLLFCLSLMPFATAWMGEHPFEVIPTVVFGIVFLCSAISYTLLQKAIILKEGKNSILAKAVGDDIKGKVSLGSYIAAVLFAFVHPIISYGFFAFVALLWMWPDPRITAQMKKNS